MTSVTETTPADEAMPSAHSLQEVVEEDTTSHKEEQHVPVDTVSVEQLKALPVESRGTFEVLDNAPLVHHYLRFD